MWEYDISADDLLSGDSRGQEKAGRQRSGSVKNNWLMVAWHRKRLKKKGKRGIKKKTLRNSKKLRNWRLIRCKTWKSMVLDA